MELKAVDIKTIYDASAKPLSEIFSGANSFYEVPDYQRPYSWEDDQIQDLWDDIYVAYSEGRKVYFLGSIIVAKGEDIYKEVIDGQQRLTTLMILFCTIRDVYFKETSIKDKSQNVISDAIKSLRDDAYRLRLKTQSNSQTEFDQEILQGIKSLNDTKSPRYKDNKFVNAVRILKENLEENFSRIQQNLIPL